MNLLDVIDQNWFRTKIGSSAWIVGFRAYLVEGVDLHKAYAVEVLGVRVIVLNSEISYLSLGALGMVLIEEQLQLTAPEPKLQTEPAGIYLLLVCPHNVDGKLGVEFETKNRIATTLGLLNAHCGKNIGFDKLFEQELSADGLSTSLFSEVQTNHLSFPKIKISDNWLDRLALASNAINTLPDQSKSRISLSLRWFHDAIYENDALMSFLKLWVAIETLAMPATHIKPINEALGKIYSIPVKDASKQFMVGRIQGLRSNIVHHGKIVAIHSGMIGYLEALYFDLLNHIGGLQSERRLATKFENQDFNVREFLDQSTKT